MRSLLNILMLGIENNLQYLQYKVVYDYTQAIYNAFKQIFLVKYEEKNKLRKGV